MDKFEMLETLAEAICLADKAEDPEFRGLGDRLYEVLVNLKAEWGLENE